VEVKNGLASAGADVEDGAVSLLDIALTGDLGGGEVAAADEFGVGGLGLLQSGKMFFGNDENVRGCLRVDVFEGEDVVVFVNFLGGNFAAEDAAEEAIGIGHVEFTRAGLPGGNDTIAAAGLSAGLWGKQPPAAEAANGLRSWRHD
jgi:hypothetical protein